MLLVLVWKTGQDTAYILEGKRSSHSYMDWYESSKLEEKIDYVGQANVD